MVENPLPGEALFGDTIERLQGHGKIRHQDVIVGESDYDLTVTPPSLRRAGLTFEAGLSHGDLKTPEITGWLVGSLFHAQPYAESIHTLVLEDGRELDFRVLRPDTNEIVGVSWFRSSPEA